MRQILALTVALATALGLAACGGSSSGGGGGSDVTAGLGKQATIASEVPSDIRGKGAIQVAVDATYAPNEFINPENGQIEGWDVDLGYAIGKVLGMNFVFNNADFASIIPDLGSRYDIGISSFSPTAEREKTVDFVTYYQAGESWIIKKGGPQISSAVDMCGKTVAVETGTTEESDAWGFIGKKPDGSAIAGDADNCQKAGKPDITVSSFTKQTDADADLLGGKAQLGWADEPVADYQAKLNNQLQVTGKACSVAPYGIATTKNPALEKALADAIKYLIDNGWYTKILNKWNVASGAIKSSDVAINNNNTVGASCVPSY